MSNSATIESATAPTAGPVAPSRPGNALGNATLWSGASMLAPVPRRFVGWLILAAVSVLPSHGWSQAVTQAPSLTPTPPPLSGAIYYVTPTGDDATTGTSWATALRTLTRATQAVRPDSGDQVWVAHGTYAEDYTVRIPRGVAFYGGFLGTETDLSDREASTSPTIIDGQNQRRCVWNAGSLDGFHVVNGRVEDGNGGGICSTGSVTNCTIRDCLATGHFGGGGISSDEGPVTSCTVYRNTAWNGGGIYIDASRVTDCVVFDNTASGSGGGIYGGTHGWIDNCTVHGNTASGYGGGIYASGWFVSDSAVFDNTADSGGGIFATSASHDGFYSQSSVYNCTVHGNCASANGGGICGDPSSISNCLIYSNSAGLGGGGINSGYCANIKNCAIYGCTVSGKNGRGGGVAILGGSLRNCTVYGCTLSGENARGGGVWNEGTVTNCIVWNNARSDIDGDADGRPVRFSCFGEGRGGAGNLKAYPLFVSTEGDLSRWDFRLRDGSPCVDTGGLEDAPPSDIVENERPGGDGKVCMGAYESPADFQPQPSIGCGIRLYVKSKGGNDDADGTSWATALRTIPGAFRKADDNFHEVWVAEGTYAESATLDIPGRFFLFGGFAGIETHLSQRDETASPSILDGQNVRRCARNAGVLDGFEVVNGHAEEGDGGGVYNIGTVARCTIHDCRATEDYSSGGGVFSSEGFVTSCTVYGNLAYSGGGIYGEASSVTGCVVDDNTAVVGGGICGGAYAIIDNCTIRGNIASSSGGGICNISAHVRGCLIHTNSSRTGGGGVHNSSGALWNCTVYGNTVSGVDAVGGGIWNDGSVFNCIAWGNSFGDIVQEDGAGPVKYSCFGERWSGDGNLRCNPLFENTEGNPSTWDFRLRDGSPCVDSGGPEYAPEIDIAGNARPGDDGKICMGAYESPSHFEPEPPAGPGVRLYVKSQGGNDDADGTSWATAFHTISRAIQKADDDFHEVWVAAGTYAEPSTIYIPGCVSLYGGFSGTETLLSQRNGTTGPTILDGQNERRCVWNSGVLDGINVVNGRVVNNRGAGIYNIGAVANCTIRACKSTMGYSAEGGGIYSGAGVVTSCTLQGNASFYGGGIHSQGGSVTSCTLVDNTAVRGGGIYGEGFSVDGTYTHALIDNCRVYGNSASQDGGGIHAYAASVRGCLVHSNSARFQGGGILNSSGSIWNCTVYGNTASQESASGGGIWNDHTVVNCIAWNNTGGDIVGHHYDNVATRYSCFGDGGEGEGNLSADPLFINTEGDPSTWDFRLRDGSPCIDSGDSVVAPLFDILGVPRPQGVAVDMGAYERRFPTPNARLWMTY